MRSNIKAKTRSDGTDLDQIAIAAVDFKLPSFCDHWHVGQRAKRACRLQ